MKTQRSKIYTLLHPSYEYSVNYLCLYGNRMTYDTNYNFKIIIFTTNASKLRFQSENYIWKCHWFTMFSITQTFSVEPVTLMVIAVFAARILTIFSIGLETFWKIIFFDNRSLTISCSWNEISSKIMKYLDKCITCCTIMTPPTRFTGAKTIHMPTSFTIW